MKQEFIEMLNKCSINDTFLVAVSGGPDSMGLLHKIKGSSLKLVVCNVNYKTRKESDIEEAMVKNYALSNNLIFESKVASNNEISNFQDSARVFRYTFFKEIYDKYNAKGLIVAHHLDDALETYLMQKERGSIVRQYGISYISKIQGMKVYRPLLDETKQDLLKYCKDNDVPYSIDYTNNLPKYKRNKVRLEVLNKMNAQAKHELIIEMQRKNQENNKLFQTIDKYLGNCVNSKYLNIDEFSKIPQEYQSYVLYVFLEPQIQRSSRVLSSSYLKDLCIQVQDGKPNKKYLIDQKYYLYQEYGILHVEENKKIEYCYFLEKDEELKTEYFSVSKTGDNKNGIYIKDDEYPLMIRNFKDGDEITLENGHKKLRRWFIDKKTPLSKRNKIPLLFNNQGKLLYIPGLYKDFERKNLKSTLFMIE